MALFTENLPMTIIYGKEQVDEEKFQGQFIEVKSSVIILYFPYSPNKITKGQKIFVKFFARKYEFEFVSEILNLDKNFLYIQKPDKIHKKQQRITNRIDVHIESNFTLWTEQGNHNGKILNLSSIGCKILSPIFMRKGQLISLNCAIQDEKTNIRLISQAVVVWTTTEEYSPGFYLLGLKYTTISTDLIRRIDTYITDKLAELDGLKKNAG
jgi:c-di-GMP-binding flagellar brake protein YcgR